MNKTLTKALSSGYNRLLRYALNIRWARGVHQPTNAEIFESNNLQPIATSLRRRRLTFASADHGCPVLLLESSARLQLIAINW